RINVTYYVFELIVRAPKKIFSEDISQEKMSTRGLPGCVSNGYLARHHQTLGVLAAKSCSGWPHRDSEAKLEPAVRRAGWFDRLAVRPKSAKRIPMIHLVRLRSSQRVTKITP